MAENVADGAHEQQVEVMRERVAATIPLIEKIEENNVEIEALRSREL